MCGLWKLGCPCFSEEPPEATEGAVQRILNLEPSSSRPLGQGPPEFPERRWRCNIHGKEWGEEDDACLDCMAEWEEIEDEHA